MNGANKETAMDATQISTLVINGTATVVRVIGSTAKAVRVACADGSPDNDGRTCWLPKSALSFNADYSYAGAASQIVAATVAPWLVRRLDSGQRRALNLCC